MNGIGEVLGSIFGLIILIIICVYGVMRKISLPQTQGKIVLKGVKDTIDIFREPNGIVHIHAKNDEDLFFAQGLVHAQDRLWQMEMQRRTGAGRLAEILGKAVLERDKFLRTWGFYRAAQAAYEGLSSQTKITLDAYVAGINSYLLSNPPLPLEFTLLGCKPESWTPIDVLVWSKMMSFSLSNNWNLEIQRYELLAKGLSSQRIAELTSCFSEDALVHWISSNLLMPELQQANILADATEAFPLSSEASNNWAVAGERTITGKPILANDPHLPLSVPSLWYVLHLESPQLTLYGASLPGIPGIAIGGNKHISWGITNALADVQDFYILEETSDHTGYHYKNEIHPYRTWKETIAIKKQEPIQITLRESVYGPVISDTLKVPGTKPLSLKWVSLESEDRSLDAYLGINRATNWDGFKKALQDHVAPCMNFVYADIEGNIGHFVPGKIPVRKAGHT
ncbi:MAG: penicillin acylase family protein, partial [Ktedonobacteraceae bacterium]